MINLLFIFASLYGTCGLFTFLLKFSSISNLADSITLIMMLNVRSTDPTYKIVMNGSFRFWCGFLLRCQAFLFWPSSMFRDYNSESSRVSVKFNREDGLEVFIRDENE